MSRLRLIDSPISWVLAGLAIGFRLANWASSRLRIIDSPISWVLAGLAIGFGLGMNWTFEWLGLEWSSVWLVAIGLGVFIAYLAFHGPAKRETEGRLFMAGPAFILSWVVGFAVRGILF